MSNSVLYTDYFDNKVDAFVCPYCNSAFVNYDENDIIYHGNSLKDACYRCLCLDCNKYFDVSLKKCW